MIIQESLREGGGETPLTVALSTLRLKDFRNYEEEALLPSPGVNLVVGPNAQGKTSLLEAVSLLSTGRLLRSSRDSVAIRHGATNAFVSGEIVGSGTKIAVELRQGTRKKIELNGLALPRASDVIGRIPTVSFSATDLSIVTGDPSDRRQFLDWELAQMYPAYLRHLTIYKRGLEQRNALLKQAQGAFVPAELFESWEDQMAKHGSAIRKARAEWIAEIEPIAAAVHGELSAGEVLSMTYEPKDTSLEPDELMGMLGSFRNSDIARGTTTVGPHRDELVIAVESQEARIFGSQGQQRTAVIALKVAVLESLESHLATMPVLLLDDVFSDLDVRRRSRLVETALKKGGQVFLTCTESEQVGDALVDQSKVFQVECGRIQDA